MLIAAVVFLILVMLFVMIVLAIQNDRLVTDLRVMTADRDGLEQVVTKQRELIEGDASGRVKRGARGRFVSVRR